MKNTDYHLHLKGYVGGYDFDSNYVDYVLAQNKDKPVNVLIDSLGGSLAKALSIASAFKAHGNVSVHFVGMNASAATIASLGAKHISMDSSAMYLVHKCSTEFFEWGSLNADQLEAVRSQCDAAIRDLNKLDNNIATMYAGKCSKPQADLLDLMRQGGWLSATEAKQWGFVDEVTDFNEPKPVLTDAVASAMAAAGIPVPDIFVETKEPLFSRFMAALLSIFGMQRENTIARHGGENAVKAVAQAQGCVSALGGMITKVDAGIAQMEAAGMTNTDQYKALVAQKAQLEGSRDQLQASETRLSQLSKYADGVNLLCNQSGVGIAPVLGIDYRVGKFNFAAKYEFKTEIRMKNESTVFDASEIDAVNKYRDSEEIPEDAPAQLALGAQWSPIEVVRLNLGSHYFFDKQARWYGDSQKKLDHNSYEILAGAEWDVSDRVTISLGGQLTRYGLTDQYMNDISFVVNSYSIGFGANFKVNDKVTLKGGYFQTNYGDYDRTNYPEAGHNDSFTRTNYVLGLGCELTL